MNHEILLTKLKHYGLDDTACKVFQSYISNREQFVEYQNAKSNYLPIQTGVPQGSVLGPLLFIIYINDLPNASNIFNTILYADDATLITHLDRRDNEHTKLLNEELNKLNIWLKLNKLSLNTLKTKFMTFSHGNKKYSVPKLQIDNAELQYVNNFNYLGLILNSNLNWSGHIKKVTGKLAQTAGILNRLKYEVPMHILSIIYNSLILPHIMYAILLWGIKHHPVTILQKK